jgi:hypothetical protein
VLPRPPEPRPRAPALRLPPLLLLLLPALVPVLAALLALPGVLLVPAIECGAGICRYSQQTVLNADAFAVYVAVWVHLP